MENLPGIMSQAGYEFIGKAIAWPTGSGALRASALNHEIVNNPMKGKFHRRTRAAPN